MSVRELRDDLGHSKPLIGVVHLLPLPGSPRYGGSLERVIARALQDAQAYEAARFDALIVENYGDAPFVPERVAPETVAAMTAAVWEIKKRVRLPLGLNVLRNDARAALGIACVVDARFIRVNVHSGVMVTDQGILQGRAWETLRERARLAPGVRVYADVHVKHGHPLGSVGIVGAAWETAERALADALILTGEATGAQTPLEDLSAVKSVLRDTAVLVGSGVTPENLSKLLAWADGAIVGTWAKEDGVTEAPVDPARARALVQARDEWLEHTKRGE